MSENVSFTKEQFQEFLHAISQNKLNPLEQKKLEEELRKDRRKLRRSIEEGYSAELKRWAQQNGCTHSRWPAGHRNAGESAPRGQGEWTTGGQVSGNVISLLCLRCQTTWKFEGTQQEVEYANNSASGLMCFPPPPVERCLNKDQFISVRPVAPVFQPCQKCGEEFTEKELAKHACS